MVSRHRKNGCVASKIKISASCLLQQSLGYLLNEASHFSCAGPNLPPNHVPKKWLPEKTQEKERLSQDSFSVAEGHSLSCRVGHTQFAKQARNTDEQHEEGNPQKVCLRENGKSSAGTLPVAVGFSRPSSMPNLSAESGFQRLSVARNKIRKTAPTQLLQEQRPVSNWLNRIKVGQGAGRQRVKLLSQTETSTTAPLLYGWTVEAGPATSSPSSRCGLPERKRSLFEKGHSAGTSACLLNLTVQRSGSMLGPVLCTCRHDQTYAVCPLWFPKFQDCCDQKLQDGLVAPRFSGDSPERAKPLHLRLSIFT